MGATKNYSANADWLRYALTLKLNDENQRLSIKITKKTWKMLENN